MIASEVLAILMAFYDSACRRHFLSRLMAQKIMIARYYWPTKFQAAHDYVKQYNAYQGYEKNDLHIVLPLHISLSLVPFKK